MFTKNDFKFGDKQNFDEFQLKLGIIDLKSFKNRQFWAIRHHLCGHLGPELNQLGTDLVFRL